MRLKTVRQFPAVQETKGDSGSWKLGKMEVTENARREKKTMVNEMTESATNMYKMDGPDMNE